MPSSLACSWAHLWVLGKLSAGSTPCTTIEKALSGQLPCVPYLPRDFPVPANKPVLSWLHLILLQEPFQPGSTSRILQIRAARNLLPLCASPIPKDRLGSPKNFLAEPRCFGVLATSSTSASISGGRVMGSQASLFFGGPHSL